MADIQKEAAAKGGLAPAAKMPEKGVYAPGTAPRATLQYMVLWEVDRKVEKLNAGKYISGARSLLRLMWFMDFLGILINHLTEDTKELKEMASDAYDRALGPHHPWLVRKGIQAAMMFCPGKAKFWTNLLAESTVTDPKAIKTTLIEFLAQMEPVRAGLWEFYRANKLDELP